MSKSSEWVRRVFKEGDDERDAGLTTPEDIERFDDIVYGDDPAQQSLDVYRPKAAAGQKLPVIVSVHGGGWVYGDKERYQYYCMSLAERGFAVINFTYRLAPENKFPAPLEDTNAVFTWMFDHADDYGFDVEHVFGVGDSAGGNLLALYSCLCTNDEYAAFFDFAAPEGFAPTAVGLNCGSYVISMEVDESLPFSTAELMGDLLPGGAAPDEVKKMQVLDYVTGAFPPAFVMTSTGDFLQADALALAAKLVDVKVPFVARLFGTAENLLPHVFHCNMKLADAALCNDEECDFFKEFCE